MGSISLKAELKHELKMTPQLMQSMKVLQMNSQELLEYLGRTAEENPVLEQEDAPDLRNAYAELRSKASWLDGGVGGSTFTHTEEREIEYGAVDKALDNLTSLLCDQLERKRLPKPLLALAKYIAELVDPDGYLAQEDLDAVIKMGVPEELYQEALSAVQSLEPLGVGARSLSECLLLQLAARKDVSPTALDVAARFLPELGRKHYSRIAKELGVTVEEVQEAEKLISSLEPYPGRLFQPEEPTVYVRPDVFVVELDGVLQVLLNEYYLPRISISGYYSNLLTETEEQETKDYLRQKIQQAKWLLNCLERRGGTLRRCAEAVLESQRAFFEGKTGELAPMGIAALAERLELHPSTVSRAINGKYLQCAQGTYPLRYFFNRAVGEDGASQQAVKQKLLLLIRDEDTKHPLSDQTLCRLLSVDGVQLARRTVAKYRLELGIGSSTARKR